MTDLKERGQALEDQFFSKHDRELIENAKAEREESEKMREVAEVTGIEDAELLARIINAGVSVDSAAALSLAPLVIVAWADGEIQELERKAILEAAKESGVTNEAAQKLIESWLDKRPAASLIEAWERCTADLATRLDAEEKAKLAEQIMSNARKVAASAGGVIGFGRISSDEKAALDRLQAALS